MFPCCSLPVFLLPVLLLLPPAVSLSEISKRSLFPADLAAVLIAVVKPPRLSLLPLPLPASSPLRSSSNVLPCDWPALDLLFMPAASVRLSATSLYALSSGKSRSESAAVEASFFLELVPPCSYKSSLEAALPAALPAILPAASLAIAKSPFLPLASGTTTSIPSSRVTSRSSLAVDVTADLSPELPPPRLSPRALPPLAILLVPTSNVAFSADVPPEFATADFLA
mmetsp:Transcript_7523/g.22238  ORF Transcript_7523/g.22238 Transcript_7523/m.22238 type:complete len:226 (-) Transcript_7523:2584-3261(-)